MNHLPSVVKIDLIPRKDAAYRHVEFERCRWVEVTGSPLWIVGVEDLVLSELEWARDPGSEQPFVAAPGSDRGSAAA